MIGFKLDYDKNGNPYAVIKDGCDDVAILSDDKYEVQMTLIGHLDIDDMRELCNCLNELRAEMRRLYGSSSED